MLAQKLNLEMLCNQSVCVLHVFGAEDMKPLSMADIEKKNPAVFFPKPVSFLYTF